MRSLLEPAMFLAVVILLLASGACGGGLSAKDKQSIVDSTVDQANLLDLCAPADAGEGECKPGHVRALSRATYCTLAATLVRNGEKWPDAGVTCTAR